jgi:hypothetical protein
LTSIYIGFIIGGMIDETAEEVRGMALIRSPQSFNLVREQYEALDNGENKVLVSFFLRPTQKRLIDGIAAQTGRGKAEVVREIIDEWCQLQLESVSEGG